ncbi:MAG: DEAD/DEAH box helicase family protein, partial [Aeriscardovia sp.]|nr:DEAD/DEAH box helicase family protein [Aeriscardovia sp.]
MLREVQELQEEAVEGILSVLETKDEVTFKAPTGSGKTHMMADLMNRVLSQHSRAVFLVSTLSKGGLAEQNFEKFKEYGKEFPRLSPYLVSSEDFAEEARPFIPSGYNVYVLGRNSYKLKNSRLTHVF